MAKIPSETTLKIMRQEKYDLIQWNSTEIKSKERFLKRNKILSEENIQFCLALQVQFRRSIFGLYLDFYNPQQTQDKCFNENKYGITEWDMKAFDPQQRILFQESNDNTDDVMELLKNAIKEKDVIDWQYLYEKLQALRIPNYNITEVDESLLHFRNLRVLVLVNNWISDIKGEILPRRLQFLELGGNLLDSVENLVKKAPPLVHIGLARNKLTDDSKFHLVGRCRKFNNMRTLDLSENNICDLVELLENLKSLNTLTGLTLEGNPCYTCASYKEVVLSRFPKLLFLDNTGLLANDRVLGENVKEGTQKSALTFTCHRVFNLPAPPKTKGVKHFFHFEISLPLLEEITIEPEPESEEAEEEEKLINIKEKGKKAKKDKKSKGSSKKSKKGKKRNPYDAPDEYQTERLLKIKNTAVKTERFQWSKKIQLPEAFLTVESQEKNNKLILDTLKSVVNVKFIYQQILLPQKKKAKKDNVKKGKDKSKEENKKEEKPPAEEILKKITLANFNCELRPVNWSDRSVDFYWADHPKTTPNAIPVEGSLRAINYIEGKKGKKKKDKKGKKGGEAEVFKVPSKQFAPEIFTVQVGFGLLRSHFNNKV